MGSARRAVGAYLTIIVGFAFGSAVGVRAQQAGERVYAGAAQSTFLLEITNAAGEPKGSATGFLVADNKIITNAHVADAGTISVRMGTFSVPCHTQRVDRLNDIALCELAAKSTAPLIKFAASEPPPGATVYALGNPRGLENTISQGLFTGYRQIEGRRVAQMSAAISPGSSGGPILNSSGELVGVAVASLVNGQSLNFAVPLAVVRDFVAGKITAASDIASLLDTAGALRTRRDGVSYDAPEWEELNAEFITVLRHVINDTNDVSVLGQVRELAGVLNTDIQVEAARKTIQLTKTPTREMYGNLASSLYYDTQEAGPSPQLTEAEQAASRAVSLGKGLVISDLVLLADIQTQAGKTKDAYATLLRATAVPKPASDLIASVYMRLFRTSGKLSQNTEAESWFKKSAALDPPAAWEWAEYGGFLDRLTRYDEAGAAWMAAFQSAPKLHRYICESAASYYFASKLDQAISVSRQCLELAAVNGATEHVAQAHRHLADMLLDRGVYEESANHSHQAIAISATDASAHHTLARALILLRRPDEAIAAVRTAIRLTDGKYADTHFTLGHAHFDLKQWPEAAQAFTKAAALSPKDSTSAYNVAASYYNSRYFNEAISWYREALKRNPNREDRAEILKKIADLSAR